MCSFFSRSYSIFFRFLPSSFLLALNFFCTGSKHLQFHPWLGSCPVPPAAGMGAFAGVEVETRRVVTWGRPESGGECTKNLKNVKVRLRSGRSGHMASGWRLGLEACVVLVIVLVGGGWGPHGVETTQVRLVRRPHLVLTHPMMEDESRHVKTWAALISESRHLRSSDRNIADGLDLYQRNFWEL